VEKFIVGILAISSVLIAFWGTISRYLLRNPPDWAEEIVVYLIIWAGFICASTLAAQKGHVAATLLVERFPMKARRYLAVFNGLAILVFCAIISFLGFKIVSSAYAYDERSLTALRFPLWIPYLSVPIGCSLVFVRYVLHLLRVMFSYQPSEILEVHELDKLKEKEEK
jgi:C4-dicarboxylate transporter DctQ subunit